MAEEILSGKCDAVYFPKEEIRTPSGAIRTRAIIPHVLFIKTTHENALSLELRSRQGDENIVPFWIYRYVKDGDIQVITESQIKILQLLTANDSTKCEIFNRTDFRKGQYVRVTGGFYEGQEGYVQRVKKNKHVVVKIEGICMVLLPFIHPDLLEVIHDSAMD